MIYLVFTDEYLDATVTLFPLPSFGPPTVLASAKAAFSFGIHTYIYHEPQESKAEEGTFSHPTVPSIPTLITTLIVGCRRKAVVYSWKDGEPQESRVRESAFLRISLSDTILIGMCSSSFSSSDYLHG